MVQCYDGTMMQWYDGAMIRWYNDTIIWWCNDAMIRWCAGTMVLWNDGTMIRCNGAMELWPIARWRNDMMQWRVDMMELGRSALWLNILWYCLCVDVLQFHLNSNVWKTVSQQSRSRMCIYHSPHRSTTFCAILGLPRNYWSKILFRYPPKKTAW